MDFDKKIYNDFTERFGGLFYNMISSSKPVYEDEKGNVYFLEVANIESLINKSLKDNINYLLANQEFISEPNLFY